MRSSTKFLRISFAASILTLPGCTTETSPSLSQEVPSSGGTPGNIETPLGAGGTTTAIDGTGGVPASGGNSSETDPLLAEGWELVFNDEFDGTSIDSSKWSHEVNCWGGGNAEQQCYVPDSKNSYVADGMLHIVALADSPTGTIGGPGGDPTQVTMPYSSARLNSAGKATFKYGRFEARIQLPFGQGLWPAFWMLPTNSVYGGWARSGEIDIMEAVSLSRDNNLVYGTIHYGDSWPGNVHTGESYDPGVYLAENFVTYAVEWEEGEIRWYAGPIHYATQTDWWSAGAAYPAPFNEQFHLLLNVAVGGQWPGNTDATTTFPQTMLVDYVRVYRCTKDPATGKGC